MCAESICVAVRVRPFNSREIKRKSKLCIKMNVLLGQVEIIAPPDTKKLKKNKYTFDYTYWSFDESKKENCKKQRIERAEKGGFECKNLEDDRNSNMDVYNDLGKKILENAWLGYNASIFAYGQTGSGKSYSMVGYGEDLGIIPLICNELFERVLKLTSEKTKFKVQASMIEIYNEQVQDLFGSKKGRPPGGLKVREHPKFGPYVEGLKILPVKNYTEINDLMERGSRARTVASTQMNATSSRAHTLFSIILTITEIDKEKGKAMDRVDLAGSERSDATGATGDRLKEGCAINQSLSALGNVISMLVKKCMAKTKKKKAKIFIPYRTSVLTWLLRESLGGNSRTIMVAALSPASINYEETLGTLKYADRAKQIKNKAVVNEDPNVTLIKGLRKELNDLKKKLEMTDLSKLEALQEQLKASQDLIARLQQSDDEGEKEKNEFKKNSDEFVGELTIDTENPSISNLHPDSLMNKRIIFVIRDENTIVGRNVKSNVDAKIKLGGVSIKMKHFRFERRDDGKKLFAVSTNEENAHTYINGVSLEKEIELHHLDRIIIGSNHTFLVHIQSEKEEIGEEKHNELEEDYDYVFARQEFAEKQGLKSMVDEDEQELIIQQKIKEEMQKIDEKKKKEEKRLEEQRKALLEKQKEMERQFKNWRSSGDFREKKKLFEEERIKQEQELEKQRLYLERKRIKLEEEAKKEEEIRKRIRENELKERQKRRNMERKLLELIPMVYECNDYSQELKKDVKFRVKLVNFVEEDDFGKPAYTTDIVIETESIKTGATSIWKYEKFESRFYQIQTLYQDYIYKKEQNDKYELNLKKEEDPFWDPDASVEKAQLLGISMFYLKCLGHQIDMNIWTPIYKGDGSACGDIKVGVIPCNKEGKSLLDSYVPESTSLIGKPLFFKVLIENARGIPANFCTDCSIQFKLPFLKEFKGKVSKTIVVDKKTRFPKFNFEKLFTIKNVTQETIDYLGNSAIKFEFYAKPSDQIVESQISGSKNVLCALQKLMGIMGSKQRRNTNEKKDNLKIPKLVSVFKRLQTQTNLLAPKNKTLIIPAKQPVKQIY